MSAGELILNVVLFGLLIAAVCVLFMSRKQ